MRTNGTRRIRVEEVGHALLVSSNGVHRGCHAVARSVPAEPGRICVVMPDADMAADPYVAQRLREWAPQRFESVRLAAARAATHSPRLGQPPAQAMCDLLDVEVVAPDGDLVAAPEGWLFVPPEADGSARGWWRFRPGRPPELIGRRFPTPEWEHALADFPSGRYAELMVEEIPAGVWVRRSGGPRRDPDPGDLAYAVAPMADSMALLVARAGDPPIRLADLRRLVEATPDALRDRIVVIPYGDQPVADGQLGEVVSLAMNRTLRVRTGLPLRLAGLGSQVVAVGADGNPTWAPFAREISWRPQGGARIHSWAPPGEQLLAAGPAQFLLNEQWVVEVVEAGLWIRESHRTDGATQVRQLALDAEHCTVVIGVSDVTQKPPPWRAVRRLLRRLPDQARRRLRLTVPAGAGEWFAALVTRNCRRMLAGRALAILTSAGSLVTPEGSRPPTHVVSADRRGERDRLARRRSNRRPAKQDATDLSRLLGFVEEIRQTPAWDEQPSRTPVPWGGAPVPAHQQRASTVGPMADGQAHPDPVAVAVATPAPASASAEGRDGSPASGRWLVTEGQRGAR